MPHPTVPSQTGPLRRHFDRPTTHSWSLYGAFSASTLVHIAVLVVCAAWLMPSLGGSPAIDVAAKWSSVARQPLEPTHRLQPQARPTLDPTGGSSSPATMFVLNRPLKVEAVREPVQRRLIPRNANPANRFNGHWAEEVGEFTRSRGGKQEGQGNGIGTGSGGGASAGPGFFGIKAEANSIVYVVDSSGSMNLPHDSKWKTRYRRLKAEIVKSVGEMSPGQRFYIIFFNSKAMRMPARSLQPAEQKRKTRYLKWMIAQKAKGETDPRGALHYALALQPDVIYFLTDGMFRKPVKRDLLKIRQNNVAIHTFAFGDRRSEETMQQIAKSNGGRYHFVP